MSQTNVYQKARLSRDTRFDGQFFIAVKSTGIFCRNICPAKLPKEENVEYFNYAAQAINVGYRPCLRCRPESAPSSCAWQGTTTTLNRAVNILRSIPELSLKEVSDKLGITDRYLRKLFNEKLGVSPKAFQLSEQVLFAKKLLHQSQLTIEQVAISAGFQSARRLQVHIKQQLKLNPSQIRKQVRHKDVSQKLTLSLSYREPYNWPQVRAFLARRAIDKVENVTDESYRRSFTWQACRGHFVATLNEKKRCFEVEISLSNLEHLYPVVQNIRRILDLNADAHLIASQLHQAGITKENLTTGLRLPGVWSLFETGCRAIIGQQISVTAAINQLNLFCHIINDKQQNKSKDTFFPSPITVAQTDLSFLKMPNSRKQTLHDFAVYMSKHETKDPEHWLDIKGIGPWTVAYGKLRGQSNPDVWLNSDLIIKKMVKTCQIDSDIAKPWRSYLTLQLWELA